MDSGACAEVFAALSHYRTALPRLWAVSQARRLLAIPSQPPAIPVVYLAQLCQGQQCIERKLAAMYKRAALTAAAQLQATAALQIQVAASSAKLQATAAMQTQVAEAAAVISAQLQAISAQLQAGS